MTGQKHGVRVLLLPVMLVLFVASPLLGEWLGGEPAGPYLQFPPEPLKVEHPEFSWTAFILILGLVAWTTWPFWRRLTRGRWKPGTPPRHARFPWWGWLALAGLAVFWVLAWTRFEWFAPLQRHTFFPLWFCFIIVLNAQACRLSGTSLLTHRPLYFGLLFPLSAVFWWAFEYLNRFVNNWYYVGVEELGGWQYFAESSLAFSTVLPAVMSTRFLIMLMPVFRERYSGFPSMPWLESKRLWSVLGLTGVLALAGLGWYPEFTYPMVWVAPGLLWVAFELWSGHRNPLLTDAARGDLSLVWSSAIAALLCGFFWELWNIHSLAQWIYNIPGVERFYIFEMPVLGYAGYLPFGVICALVSNRLLARIEGRMRAIEEQVEN